MGFFCCYRPPLFTDLAIRSLVPEVLEVPGRGSDAVSVLGRNLGGKFSHERPVKLQNEVFPMGVFPTKSQGS